MVAKNIITLETFAYSPSTINYIKTYGMEDAPIPDSVMLAHMDAINTKMDDGNASIILSVTNGDQLLRTDRKELVNISDRDYLQKCKETKQLVVSNVIVSKSSGNRITIIIVPIFDEDQSTLIGFVTRSFDLNVMHEFLAANIDEGFIVDGNGDVAAHSDYEISPDDEPMNFSSSPYMTSSETSGTYESTATGTLSYLSWVREPVSGYTVCIAAKESEVLLESRRTAMIVVLIGVILLVIAFVISLLMANSFTKPIISVTACVTDLADGRFNKISAFDGRKDEFGEIVRSTNSVIDKLQSIVKAIKHSAATVTSSSENLSDMASQISATTEGVANSVTEIATGAVQQAEEIQQAAESVGKITDAVSGVQNSTSNMETLATKMKDASQTSSKSLSNLQASSSDMTVKIDEIAKTISATQDAVSNINESVEGISGIASQTNLLSLNASIEAARAGEAGKGFAVVAEEIRKLADDSESMAQDIRTQMDALLQQASAAVNAANEIKQGNLEQQDALGETLESVNGMLEDIDGTVEGVHDIADGADTCVSSNQIVSDAMSSLSAISEENAASSETTGASVQELSATVSTLAESAIDLKEIAEKLNEEISFFKD